MRSPFTSRYATHDLQQGEQGLPVHGPTWPRGYAGYNKDFITGHAAEHDVHHLCTTLARQCHDHAERLRPLADRYGQELPEADPPAPDQGLLAGLRRKGSELTGRQPPAGVLLLHDLRRLYLMAQECQIDWEMVGQGAKAARDKELLATVTDCMERTDVQVRWLTTRIKEAAPQTLTVG